MSNIAPKQQTGRIKLPVGKQSFDRLNRPQASQDSQMPLKPGKKRERKFKFMQATRKTLSDADVSHEQSSSSFSLSSPTTSPSFSPRQSPSTSPVLLRYSRSGSSPSDSSKEGDFIHGCIQTADDFMVKEAKSRVSLPTSYILARSPTMGITTKKVADENVLSSSHQKAIVLTAKSMGSENNVKKGQSQSLVNIKDFWLSIDSKKQKEIMSIDGDSIRSKIHSQVRKFLCECALCRSASAGLEAEMKKVCDSFIRDIQSSRSMYPPSLKTLIQHTLNKQLKLQVKDNMKTELAILGSPLKQQLNGLHPMKCVCIRDGRVSLIDEYFGDKGEAVIDLIEEASNIIQSEAHHHPDFGQINDFGKEDSSYLSDDDDSDLDGLDLDMEFVEFRRDYERKMISGSLSQVLHTKDPDEKISSKSGDVQEEDFHRHIPSSFFRKPVARDDNTNPVDQPGMHQARKTHVDYLQQTRPMEYTEVLEQDPYDDYEPLYNETVNIGWSSCPDESDQNQHHSLSWRMFFASLMMMYEERIKMAYHGYLPDPKAPPPLPKVDISAANTKTAVKPNPNHTTTTVSSSPSEKLSTHNICKQSPDEKERTETAYAPKQAGTSSNVSNAMHISEKASPIKEHAPVEKQAGLSPGTQCDLKLASSPNRTAQGVSNLLSRPPERARPITKMLELLLPLSNIKSYSPDSETGHLEQSQSHNEPEPELPSISSLPAEGVSVSAYDDDNDDSRWLYDENSNTLADSPAQSDPSLSPLKIASRSQLNITFTTPPKDSDTDDVSGYMGYRRLSKSEPRKIDKHIPKLALANQFRFLSKSELSPPMGSLAIAHLPQTGQNNITNITIGPSLNLGDTNAVCGITKLSNPKPYCMGEKKEENLFAKTNQLTNFNFFNPADKGLVELSVLDSITQLRHKDREEKENDYDQSHGDLLTANATVITETVKDKQAQFTSPTKGLYAKVSENEIVLSSSSPRDESKLNQEDYLPKTPMLSKQNTKVRGRISIRLARKASSAARVSVSRLPKVNMNHASVDISPISPSLNTRKKRAMESDDFDKGAASDLATSVVYFRPSTSHEGQDELSKKKTGGDQVINYEHQKAQSIGMTGVNPTLPSELTNSYSYHQYFNYIQALSSFYATQFMYPYLMASQDFNSEVNREMDELLLKATHPEQVLGSLYASDELFGCSAHNTAPQNDSFATSATGHVNTETARKKTTEDPTAQANNGSLFSVDGMNSFTWQKTSVPIGNTARFRDFFAELFPSSLERKPYLVDNVNTKAIKVWREWDMEPSILGFDFAALPWLSFPATVKQWGPCGIASDMNKQKQRHEQPKRKNDKNSFLDRFGVFDIVKRFDKAYGAYMLWQC